MKALCRRFSLATRAAFLLKTGANVNDTACDGIVRCHRRA
jgi:hypothetical protein